MNTIKIVNIYLFFILLFTNAMFDYPCLPSFRTDTSIVPLKSTTTCNITKSTNITKLSKFKCKALHCVRLLFQIISGQLMPERGLMLDPRAGVMLSTCIVCNEACRACDWDGAKVSPQEGWASIQYDVSGLPSVNQSEEFIQTLFWGIRWHCQPVLRCFWKPRTSFSIWCFKESFHAVLMRLQMHPVLLMSQNDQITIKRRLGAFTD